MSKQVRDIIRVRDTFQTDYSYVLSAPEGGSFHPDFHPAFSPKKMLSMGVFEGKYCNDCRQEFPTEWFEDAKISDTPDQELNHFGVKSRQDLSVWKKKGWIIEPDPRGWFQWYCRYYLGRRLEGVDQYQIKRWKGFARHAGQVKKNCQPADVFCRPRQRQALLQWAYDPFI
ncbi:MAG: hypothetical protein ACR2PF_07255 [Rhizobiaceae bacterium]